MLVKNIKMTLLRVDSKSGVSKKTGNSYSFLTGTFVDEDSNVFKMNLGDKLVEDLTDVSKAKLLELRNESVECDVEFRPKGFDVSGVVLTLE